MSRTNQLTLVIAALGSLAAAVPALAQQESEPNDTLATADGPYVPPLTVGGMFQATNDRDYFAFTLPTTSDVRIAATAVSPSSCYSTDVIVELLNSAGTVI